MIKVITQRLYQDNLIWACWHCCRIFVWSLSFLVVPYFAGQKASSDLAPLKKTHFTELSHMPTGRYFACLKLNHLYENHAVTDLPDSRHKPCVFLGIRPAPCELSHPPFPSAIPTFAFWQTLRHYRVFRFLSISGSFWTKSSARINVSPVKTCQLSHWQQG